MNVAENFEEMEAKLYESSSTFLEAQEKEGRRQKKKGGRGNQSSNPSFL